jgi:hypothetical protein
MMIVALYYIPPGVMQTAAQVTIRSLTKRPNERGFGYDLQRS